MDSEIYTAAQGLIARQYQLDTVANNIANVSTTGFREMMPFFRSHNKALAEGPVNPLNGAANNQPVIAGIYAHSKQGPIKSTGEPLDLAINGEGYFKLNTAFGPRYTRNGHFTLKPLDRNTGILVTDRGYEVLDTFGNPIRLDLRAEDFHISREGRVIQDGVERGQIGLVTFDVKDGLVPEEDTLLAMQDPIAQEIPAGGEMRQGYLEASNVNIAKQMIDMIAAQRAYEAHTRTVKAIDMGMNQAVIQGFRPR